MSLLVMKKVTFPRVNSITFGRDSYCTAACTYVGVNSASSRPFLHLWRIYGLCRKYCQKYISCISHSALRTANISSSRPLSFHALKRSCTVDLLLYRDVSSFHCAPVCPIHRTPFNTLLFVVLHGLPALPVLSLGNISLIRSHSLSSISYVPVDASSPQRKFYTFLGILSIIG